MSTFSNDDAELIRQAYDGALQRDPEERAEYLNKLCAGRPDVLKRVNELLAARLPQPAVRGDDPTISGQEGALPETERATTDRRIGNYIIRRELGRGGMGVVYLADDVRLSRRVALKAVGPWVSHTPGLRDRLRSEAQLAGRLCHPGIATVYALEEIGDELYVACEFVHGSTLRACVNSGPLPVEQVVDIGLQVARALMSAHTEAIVHRDIKPENVIKTPSGVVKILDFGLARVEDSGKGITQTGMIIGTPAYLSPEQADGQPVDFRCDQFALGIVLYELASGRNPFVDKTATGTLARIREMNPPPLSTVLARRVPSLDRVIAKCLQKDPTKRYGSTHELVDDLQRVQTELAGRTIGEVQAFVATPSSSRQWLVVHQLAMCVVYVGMLAPMWMVRAWIAQPWSLVYLFATLAPAAIGTALRLHLSFRARTFPQDFIEQHRTTSLYTRASDAMFALAQLVAAALIGPAHPEFAMLLIAVSSAVLVATFEIEPATARAVRSAPAAP